MNDTLAYKSDDRNWKSLPALLRLLVDHASKNVNFLLNVGPKPNGVIPGPSVNRLEEIGKWLRVNGEAIYGTQESPFPYESPWGRATQRGSNLYLHLFDWPRRNLKVYGLRNPVKRAEFLADRRRKVLVSEFHDTERDVHELTLILPARRPQKFVTVIKLDLIGSPDAIQIPIQQQDGGVSLPALLSCIRGPANRSEIRIGQSGVVEYWTDKSRWVNWDFHIREPGRFTVRVILGTCRATGRKLTGGHVVSALVGGQRIEGSLGVDNRVAKPGASHFYFQEAYTDIGTVAIDRAGVYELNLRAEKVNPAAPAGIVLSALELLPQ